MLTLHVQESDNLVYMDGLAEESIDVIFADPPYNIKNKPNKQVAYSTNEELIKKNWSPHYAEYDTISDYWAFTREWLTAARRIIKPKGSIFITGTYHNIHSIGVILKELDFYCVAEIAWCKPNAMPNLAMYGPTQAVEWVLWYRKHEKPAHIYDKVAAKSYTENGVNVKTYWLIPKPSDKEIIYPGKKPIALVYRCIDLSTDKDKQIVVLDPFCGSGTTGDATRYLAQKYDTPFTCYLVDSSSEAIALTQKRLSLPMKPKNFYV